MTLNVSFSNILDNLEGPLTLGLKDQRGTLPIHHITSREHITNMAAYCC